MLRIGEGYDLHGLSRGGPLRLACIEVPAAVSAVGHSDGDAATHALCDALLGALALGDLGSHFPSSEERWKGVASREFLRAVTGMLAQRGARVVNVDVTIVLQAPPLAPHTEPMRSALARELAIAKEAVSVKVKSADGLGPVGEGVAVEARAVVLVETPG